MTSHVLAISLEPRDASSMLFLGHLGEQMPAVQVAGYADADLGRRICENVEALLLQLHVLRRGDDGDSRNSAG